MEIAELFFVLLTILLATEKKRKGRQILILMFGASLIASHYLIAYLYMGFLLLSLFILPLLKKRSLDAH